MDNNLLITMAVSILIGAILTISSRNTKATSERAKILNYGKTHSIIGSFFIFTGTLPWLILFFLMKEAKNLSSSWVALPIFISLGLIFLLPGIYFFRKGSSGIKASKDIKRHLGIIINDGLRDVEIIAQKTGSKDVLATLASIQNVINLGFLPHFSIDTKSGRIIEDRPTEVNVASSKHLVFRCHACGGNNSKYVSDAQSKKVLIDCEWCGTPFRTE